MSLEWMIWALDQDVDLPGMKLVLVILGNYADESGVCWPSQRTLEKKSSMSARAVRDNLARLQEAGLVACRSRTKDNGEYLSNIYQLMGRPHRQILPMDRPAADSADGRVCRRQNLPPNQENYKDSLYLDNSVRNLVAAAAISSATNETSEYVQAVLELFVEASGRPPRLPSAADRDLAGQLFREGIPLQSVESAIMQILVRNLESAVSQGVPLMSIRSLKYFLEAIREEQRLGPPRANYYEFLRFRIRELKQQLDAPQQGELRA